MLYECFLHVFRKLKYLQIWQGGLESFFECQNRHVTFIKISTDGCLNLKIQLGKGTACWT